MSKFEKAVKSLTVFLEFSLIYTLGVIFEAGKMGWVALLICMPLSVIVAAYIYIKSHDLNNFILNIINKI